LHEAVGPVDAAGGIHDLPVIIDLAEQAVVAEALDGFESGGNENFTGETDITAETTTDPSDASTAESTVEEPTEETTVEEITADGTATEETTTDDGYTKVY